MKGQDILREVKEKRRGSNERKETGMEGEEICEPEKERFTVRNENN